MRKDSKGKLGRKGMILYIIYIYIYIRDEM